MKKLLILILFYALPSYAQNIPDSVPFISLSKPKLDKHEYFRLMVISSMTHSINYDNLMKAPKGFAQLVSVSITFNKDGAIDTAIVTTKANQHFILKKNPTTELQTYKPVLDYITPSLSFQSYILGPMKLILI